MRILIFTCKFGSLFTDVTLFFQLWMGFSFMGHQTGRVKMQTVTLEKKAESSQSSETLWPFLFHLDLAGKTLAYFQFDS